MSTHLHVNHTIALRKVSLTLILLLLIPASSFAQPPTGKPRLDELRHLDLTYSFAAPATRAAWEARAAALRQQILAAAGLLPMPERTPLRAEVFGLIDRGDHTIEKVHFASYPGFYVTGNLYRPKRISGQAGNKLPAVLCPHGHWLYGRLENQPNNSGPARAANFARQGYVAFSYDMVGYGDSTAISHRFAPGHRENLVDRESLWSINLLGLQLWNSIRAVDFLAQLSDVDSTRIACTGESGGGTQTFLLAAVDDRIAVSAPVNMVSFLMQGGSLCENAPNLRIDTNNVEVAALTAPRPLLLVSATGDWTKNLPTSEYPAIKGIYQLLGVPEKVTAVQMNAPHNYNQASREAVYGWFAHWLQGRAETTPIKEANNGVAALGELMVFAGRSRPAGEIDETQLTANLIAARKEQLAVAQPRNTASLANYREQFGAALRYALLATYPKTNELSITASGSRRLAGFTGQQVSIARQSAGDQVVVTTWSAPPPSTSYIVLVEPALDELVIELLRAGQNVIAVQTSLGGRQIPGNVKFFTTYNRTDEAIKVQEILTAIAFAEQLMRGKSGKLQLMASGKAGLLALLARGFAPKLDQTIIDADGFDNTSDDEFLRRLAIPGLRRAGDITTAVAVAPLTSLVIYNTQGKLKTEGLAAFYQRFGRKEDFQQKPGTLTVAEIVSLLGRK